MPEHSSVDIRFAKLTFVSQSN